MAHLVCSGATPELVIERRDARIKSSEFMMMASGGRARIHPRSHGAEAFMVRRRRSIGCGGVQRPQELSIILGADAEHRAIEQRILCGAARGFQHEIGAVLAHKLGGTVDQVT